MHQHANERKRKLFNQNKVDFKKKNENDDKINRKGHAHNIKEFSNFIHLNSMI